MMQVAKVPCSHTTSNSKFPFLRRINSQKSWSKLVFMSHIGLLWAQIPLFAFNLAVLNFSTKGCVRLRWKTLSFSFPCSAEQQVIFVFTVPMSSLQLLQISLLMVCADPGWPKKGLTSYLQSPMTSSFTLNSNINLEGSSGTSTRKTSLIFFPEGAGLVLHLAICPRDMWQETSDSEDDVSVTFSIRMYRYPLRTGLTCQAGQTCINSKYKLITIGHKALDAHKTSIHMGEKKQYIRCNKEEGQLSKLGLGHRIYFSFQFCEFSHEMLHQSFSFGCIYGKLFFQRGDPLLALYISLLNLASNDIQLSISWVFPLFQLYCCLLLLEVLYLCSKVLGPGDSVTAILDEAGNLLKLLDQLTIGDYISLLKSDATKMRLVGKYGQLMNQRKLLKRLVDDVIDLFCHFDEFFHFPFEYFELYFLLIIFAKFIFFVFFAHNPTIYGLCDVVDRAGQIFQAIQRCILLAKLPLIE